MLRSKTGIVSSGGCSYVCTPTKIKGRTWAGCSGWYIRRPPTQHLTFSTNGYHVSETQALPSQSSSGEEVSYISSLTEPYASSSSPVALGNNGSRLITKSLLDSGRSHCDKCQVICKKVRKPWRKMT